MIQREVVEGDWQDTTREEERAPTILLRGIPHKVKLCLLLLQLIHTCCKSYNAFISLDI
jgi:hypothetical protein